MSSKRESKVRKEKIQRNDQIECSICGSWSQAEVFQVVGEEKAEIENAILLCRICLMVEIELQNINSIQTQRVSDCLNEGEIQRRKRKIENERVDENKRRRENKQSRGEKEMSEQKEEEIIGNERPHKDKEVEITEPKGTKEKQGKKGWKQ